MYVCTSLAKYFGGAERNDEEESGFYPPFWGVLHLPSWLIMKAEQNATFCKCSCVCNGSKFTVTTLKSRFSHSVVIARSFS